MSEHDRYLTLRADSDEDPRRRLEDHFVIRIIVLIVIFGFGWLAGVWSQTNRFALPLLESLPWTGQLTRTLRLTDEQSHLTAEKLQNFERSLSRIEQTSDVTAKNQAALRTSLEAMGADLSRTQSDIAELRRRYDDSLDEISGEIGLRLDELRRRSDAQPANKAE